MSAIDFTMDIDKEENPKGDRVVVTMSGKFLPYRRAAQWYEGRVGMHVNGIPDNA